MLATAHSAIAATNHLKNVGAKNICFICLLDVGLLEQQLLWLWGIAAQGDAVFVRL